MTESGKVQKYKLRERGLSERTWDREALPATSRRTR
jgi:crotonobetaine/carnitine-CoA ligase